jgi:hypothetical protein
MEIKDFIATTLEEIIQAVEGAGTKDHLVGVAYGKPVIFDLAVTATAEEGKHKEKKGSGSIRIAQAQLSTASDSASKQEAIQRVKFEIEITESQERLRRKDTGGSVVEAQDFFNI